MSMPPSLNTVATNSTNTAAASDVFARAPPPQQPQSQQPTFPQSNNSNNHHPLSLPSPPQQQLHSFSGSSQGGVHMELPQRTSLAANIQQQPPQQHPPQLPLPTMTSTVTATMPSSNIGGSSLSPASFLTDMNKSLDDLADEFLMGPNGDLHGKSKSAFLLAPDPLPAHVSDYERLHILLKQRAYVDVLLYTRMLLEGSSSHYTSLFDAIKNLNNKSNNTSHNVNAIELALDTHKQDLVDIMTIHITAMMKLNLFQELTVELDTWSFCYHNCQYRQLQQCTANSYDTKNESISWIPWKFHILAASTLQFRQQPHSTSKLADTASQQDCLDALFLIRTAISDSTDRNDTTASLLHVENTLHNVYISMKNYRMALQCLQRIIALIPNIVQKDIHQIQFRTPTTSDGTIDDADLLRRVLSSTYQCEYLSRQGRILLQLGALDGANAIFDQIQMLWKDLSAQGNSTTMMQPGNGKASVPYILFRVMKAQLSSNDGLVKFSRGKYEEALESFNSVVQELRSSRGEKQLQPLFILESMRTNLYCETINNMALCALYTCRLHEGIQLLESLIRENVTTNFNERITLNLCTMYELAMDTSAALRKKKTLQCIATRFLIQDIPVECFRIS